jgi:tRNA modification GTPase
MAKIQTYIDRAKIAETIREGFKISIIGPPNAGKSTLLNKLASRNVAIVSDIPGTTRDLIQTKLTLLGYQIILTDTAGLRETQDQIEIQGIALAKSEA